MTTKETGPESTNSEPGANLNDGSDTSSHGGQVPPSQQVSWWSVHEFAEARLQQVDDWPPLGTPAWCLLGESDPVKWAAILDAAQHWALRLETCQEHAGAAAKNLSAAVDWSALARQLRDRADFYSARPWLKRVSS